jgi:hypothetical protein
LHACDLHLEVTTGVQVSVSLQQLQLLLPPPPLPLLLLHMLLTAIDVWRPKHFSCCEGPAS